MKLTKSDPKISNLIRKEFKRQNGELQLIPSENFSSEAVREALGSVFTHKYSEGQISKRYYEGNEIVDEIEALCKKRALEAFGLSKKWHVNVQAYAGSIANLAVYNALLKPGDKIMGMYLFDGGHLSHGWKYKNKKITLSSKIYNVAYYFVDPKTGKFDYDEVEKKVLKEKPKILISGGTAYPAEINHSRLSKIARKVKAFYLADIAHEAGLVAGGVNKSPFPYADIVTMTTHKTLRGPRGALIFSKEESSEQIDRSVFPGMQGGPFNNNIAAIAVCLKEAKSKKFKQYVEQIVRNAKKLAQELVKYGFDVVSKGTEKHLILVDLRSKEINGMYAARALKFAGITLNKNTVPGETSSPFKPSGIRLGTPTVTTRGMKEKEMVQIAKWINEVIEAAIPYSDLSFEDFEDQLASIPEIPKVKKEVKYLCSKFPLPK
ncbi:serine hydroxymethyltransferase [Candidatus Dojkabacteria bacterium]|nr:serine hydroxymethyltransferase [Candidatus Dojkabacteria bacterium]